MSKKYPCIHCGSSQTKKRLKTKDTICYDCLKIEPMTSMEQMTEESEVKEDGTR